MTTDDFDFGAPPDCASELARLQKQNSELVVALDTLQTNLRTAQSIITKYEPDCDLFSIPSFKWCIEYKPGQ